MLAKRARAKRKQQAERDFPAAHELPARTRIAGRTRISAQTQFAGRTQLAGTKSQVAECFSFGASDHDGVFSFPAALGGAELEAYLFRWLASNTHLLGCSGDNHPCISLEGLRFGPSRTCSMTLSRSILSSGGIHVVTYVVLDYVSQAVYSY